MVKAANDRATRKKIAFSLTEELVLQMLEECNSRCYYSGVEMNLNTGNKGKSNHLKVTVDRVDSSVGYTPNNVVLCCSIVNTMKTNLGVEEFRDWCKLIAANPRPYETLQHAT